MYTAPRISRQQFLNTHFLKINVAQLEKNYLHHNRFVLEIITDRNKQIVKKKFNDIKRFSQEMHLKLGLKDLAIQSHMRNSKKLQEVELLFKKLNTAYLAPVGNEAQAIKAQLRTYLYNLLFSNIEHLPSSDQEDIPSPKIKPSTVVSAPSPAKDKVEEQRVEERPKERDSTKIPNVIRSIFKSKRDSQDFRKRDTLLKNIRTIWFKEEKGWSQRLFSITEDSLILIEKSEPQHKHIIFLKFLQAALREEEYYHIILTHPLLKRDIEIRLNSLDEILKDEREEYCNFLFALKDSCEKGQREAYNFIGVYLSNKKNKFMVEPEKRPAQRLNIRLSHEDQTYNFTMGIDSGVYLQLPILSNYGRYQAEIVEQRQSGGGIIPTLSSQKSISFFLPVQSIYDQLLNERPKRKTPQMRNHILQSRQCNYSLRLEYFGLTSWKAYSAGSSSDRFQGVDEPAEFSREQFRIQRNRAKRIFYSFEQWGRYLGGLKNFQYPLQSIIFYLILLWSILLFDANHLLQYILALTCLLLAYLHPTSAAYTRDLVAYLLSSAEKMKELQGKLHERVWQQRYKVALKKCEEKRRFLQQFNMRTKKKRNILQKYNRLQQVLLNGQLALTEFVTICQKVKNLFIWYHHRKTKWLFIILLGTFFTLFFVPIRLVALAGLARMCYKGRKYYQRVAQLNHIIVLSLLRITIQEEGLTSMREHFQDTGKPFDKRASQYATFEKKGSSRLAEILQIQFDNAIFPQARNASELIELLADCRDRFVIPEEICRKYHFNLEWATHNSTLSRAIKAIYLFLLSIPSDRNILEVKGQASQEQQDSEEDDLP